MTDEKPTNEFYTAEFIDGPRAGHSEQRALIDGAFDERLSSMIAVDGLESTFWYDAVGSEERGYELHVRYTFDATSSDPVQYDEEYD